ncbi:MULTISPECIES: sugar ABC transporter substrate-binding protein [unclassified Pseudactinotalea]|uniref:sugar ABC transporter substrate-binding protein n=1 Tax=unclassified Pseudactinotalea TaxID=2649176 RepID=UPI00128E316E|nr:MULTISPECIES: sugar ABC transporter substrate-binding protein [unclassified Pseudactinotalea]MPV50751.1 substrate-binding domain-containing protein [Pseudactinotalea sp. HY160]QGH70107.1 substrate-binding domain-containing protein [Pseudactinotalea sp. HY158]
MKLFNRKIATVSIAAAAALSMVACSSSGGDAEGDDGYRVAYIARAQVDSFAAWLANEIKAEAENYPDITVEVFDGQADDEIENTMIENAIANNFDAIIIQANNGEAQRPYIEQSVAAGIVTITTNPRVEGIEGASSVDASPFDQGAVVAQYALDQVPEDAKVVVLNGPGGNFHSTERRKAWQEEFFDKRPDVEIVAEDIANWNKDEALRLMEDWVLAHPEIDAIISMNDNMAAGALEAVKNKPNFDGILAYGVDGTPEATLLIEKGLMTASTLQNAEELAELNLKTVHDLLTGVEDEVHVDIGNPLITSENVEEYLELYKSAGLID